MEADPFHELVNGLMAIAIDTIDWLWCDLALRHLASELSKLPLGKNDTSLFING